VSERVLIAGGGVAATRCALEVRNRGYGGRICIVSAETTLPYDGTPVSPHGIEIDGGERLHIAWGFDRRELEEVGIVGDE
jgi:NADPH-dependent 2,4-dienoyl-CoA reductase/sulfur reductase-like enzyme